jgi:hypothetical protein
MVDRNGRTKPPRADAFVRRVRLDCFALANKKQTVTTLILLEKLCTEKEKGRTILSQRSGQNLRHIRKSFHPRGPAGAAFIQRQERIAPGRCGTRNDGAGNAPKSRACSANFADGGEAVETDARVSGLVWIASLCSQ